jgi:hypothetical protein
MEVMREVFTRLPYGQKLMLAEGSVAYLSNRWAASREHPTGSHSTSRLSRTKPERGNGDHPRNNKSLAAKSGRE